MRRISIRGRQTSWTRLQADPASPGLRIPVGPQTCCRPACRLAGPRLHRAIRAQKNGPPLAGIGAGTVTLELLPLSGCLPLVSRLATAQAEPDPAFAAPSLRWWRLHGRSAWCAHPTAALPRSGTDSCRPGTHDPLPARVELHHRQVGRVHAADDFDRGLFRPQVRRQEQHAGIREFRDDPEGTIFDKPPRPPSSDQRQIPSASPEPSGPGCAPWPARRFGAPVPVALRCQLSPCLR